jgi:cytochrome P450
MSTSTPTVDLFCPEHLAEPWSDYALLRDQHPILWHEPTSSWLISRYEHVRPLLRDNERFSTEYTQEMIGDMLGDAAVITSMDGKRHTAMRALVSPYVYTSGLERFADTIERCAQSLILPLLEREATAVAKNEKTRAELDFVSEFTSSYPVDLMARIMGLPDRDFGRFREWYGAWIDSLANLTGDPDRHARGLRAKREFGEYILPLITQRRATSGDGQDLISLLCAAEVRGDRMNDEDIRSFLALMLTAGGETTDHQLAALMHTLIEHPDQLDELQNDRSLMDAAMSEGMRYCSIVRFMQREAREDFDLDGIHVTAGSRVTLLLSSANRDPRRFDEPDRFDMHRTDNAVSKAFTGNADHVGFGGGRHVCLGARLSKREVEIALTLLLDHATDFRLAGGSTPRYGGLMIRTLPSLKLTYQPIT